MRIISINRITAMIKVVTCPALDGVAKNSRTTKRRPRVKVVYEKSKNPDPRECMPGGLTKMETSSRTHQRKVIIAKNVVK